MTSNRLEVMIADVPDLEYRNEILRRSMQQLMSVKETTEANIRSMESVKNVTATNGSDELHYFVKNANPEEYKELVESVVGMYE